MTVPFRRSRPVRFVTALAALLTLDVLLIGLYVARDFLLGAGLNVGFLASERWLIERDRGFPEFFQYLKTVFAASLLFGLAARHRSAVYAAWCLAFAYIVVDDASGLHEAFGSFLLTTSELPALFGVDSRLYAEAPLWGAVGLALAGVAGYGHLRGHAGCRLSGQLARLFALLFLFAGVGDAAHAYVDGLDTRPSYLLGAVTVLEDGGEMIVLSTVAAWVYRHANAVRFR